jgi:hypothetical protein
VTGRRDPVGDGRPALPSGEPVLARWFAIALVVLLPIGLAVSVWALTSFDRDALGPAERRPPGTATVSHERGTAALNATTVAEPGPACATGIDVIGDDGARAAGRRALGAVCTLLGRGGLDAAATGLQRLAAADGVVRFAVFEVTGLDSSTRVEDGRPVIELNAKYQFDDASLAAPALVHELVHLAEGFPGEPVSDAGELRAMRAQSRVCAALVLDDDPPRACNDATELLASDDPLSRLGDAGYRPGR